jgi:hypothetical protein
VIGLHPPAAAPFTPPQPLCIEFIAWFDPASPPADNRTVIVRVAGLAGTWPAFRDPESAAWFSTLDGCEISEPIQAWAEQPIGAEPTGPRRAAAQDACIALLTKSAYGFGLRFTAVGRELPPGEFALQLVPKVISKTKGT